MMGSGIATACALSGVRVLLKEINQKFLDAGMARVRANLASNVKKGRMTSQKADAIYSLCTPCLTYDKFKEADMVIEAVIENLDLKQKIFADLERSCRSDCILSTNTSTIDITKVASKMRNPERILGAHFFSPAHVMQLFEIIRTDATPPQVLVDALGLSKQIKKTPVVVGNYYRVRRQPRVLPVHHVRVPPRRPRPGSVRHRQRDSRLWHAHGAVSTRRPRGARRMGVHVGQNFIDDFPLRVYESKLIPGLMKSGRMGEKSGKGFYVYDAKRAATPDPEASRRCFTSRAAAPGRFKRSTSGELLAMTADDIAEMIFFPVVNEAQVPGGGRRRSSE